MPVVRAGTSVIIKKDKKVLIGKRRGSHGEGCYAFPGGHIEFGETFKECAEREVMEETGMVVNCIPVDPNGRIEVCTTLDMLAPNKQYVTTYLFAEWVSGEAQNIEPEKCDGWEWVSLDMIRDLVRDDESKIWVPIDQIIAYRELMGL